MKRDARLGKAILEYLAQPDQTMGVVLSLAFTMYEDDCEAMDEICQTAEWQPKNWKHKRATLSAVAARLENCRYLERRLCRHNQETMEYGEPRTWYKYTMPTKYRARINPNAGHAYKPDWPPDVEMLVMLNRAFQIDDDAEAEQ